MLTRDNCDIICIYISRIIISKDKGTYNYIYLVIFIKITIFKMEFETISNLTTPSRASGCS